MEVPCVAGEVAQGGIKVSQTKVCGGGIAGVDGCPQRFEVLSYVSEESTARAACSAGAEHAQDAVISDVASGGELPKLSAVGEVLKTATRLVSCVQVTAPNPLLLRVDVKAVVSRPIEISLRATSSVRTWTW